MTNKEALEIVQNRITKMVNSPAVQSKMVQLHQEGKTTQEIQNWLTLAAIATLHG